jgi:hypothetical protein
VINEIHHSPLSGDSDEEFIELCNVGSTSADLSFWEFASGVSFVFPQGTIIPAGGHLVVAHNTTRFRQLYPNVGPGLVLGDFTGKLTGRDEHLVLRRPITVATSSGKNETVMATVSEATYAGAGRWNQGADEGGSTLELTDARANAN